MIFPLSCIPQIRGRRCGLVITLQLVLLRRTCEEELSSVDLSLDHGFVRELPLHFEKFLRLVADLYDSNSRIVTTAAAKFLSPDSVSQLFPPLWCYLHIRLVFSSLIAHFWSIKFIRVIQAIFSPKGERKLLKNSPPIEDRNGCDSPSHIPALLEAFFRERHSKQLIFYIPASGILLLLMHLTM